MYLAGVVRSDGVIDGTLSDRSPRIQPDGRTFSYLLHAGEPEIRIQQTDVRAIQLAKAALYAGARLLMDRLGVDKVDRIQLPDAPTILNELFHSVVFFNEPVNFGSHGLVVDC